MVYNIVLTKKGTNYLARIKEWPEIKVLEQTRQAAIKLVKQRLADYLTQQVEVIQVDLDLPALNKEIPNPYIEIGQTDYAPRPIIKGTAVGVELIVGCVQEGYTPEKIATSILPNLTLAQIYDALSYYEDHRDTVNHWLADEAPLPKKATVDESIVLYLAGRCSLAKAADLASVTRWDLQDIMYERGTPVQIYGSDTATEMDAKFDDWVRRGLVCSS